MPGHQDVVALSPEVLDRHERCPELEPEAPLGHGNGRGERLPHDRSESLRHADDCAVTSEQVRHLDRTDRVPGRGDHRDPDRVHFLVAPLTDSPGGAHHVRGHDSLACGEWRVALAEGEALERIDRLDGGIEVVCHERGA